MNGVFDNTSNKKYDEIKPNYDVEDGVDTIKCEEGECDGCLYKDIKLNRCLFETCILSQFPFSISYHTVFTNACKICGQEIVHIYDDFIHPFIDTNPICDTCLGKLKNLLTGAEQKNE